MKGSRNILRRNRTFIALLVLTIPLLMGGCPLGFPLICSEDVTFSLEKGTCTLITPPCDTVWEESDSFSIGFNGAPDAPTIGTKSDIFVDERTSTSGTTPRTTILRRLCSTTLGSTLNNVPGTYEYAKTGLAAHGSFLLTVYDEGILTVDTIVQCRYCPYLSSGEQLKLKANASGGSPPYLSYVITANGVQIAPASPNPPAILQNPTRNTEYKVTVTDSTNQQASDTVVVNVTNTANHPIAETNAPMCASVNTPTTINPASISGSIVRWQWDGDWHGDDGEPFETTIEGSNGSITMTWTTAGTKYVRLRFTDAQGDFDETFVAVRVGNAMCRNENSVSQEN